MKTTLLFILSILISTSVSSQVVAGQIDDFENGTAQSWEEGGGSSSSPNPPVNISTGGPNGANDNFLRNVSSGGFGAGSKMIMFNQNQWTGNYTGQSIVAIKFKAKATTNSLNLRIAFDGTGGRICTTNAFTITSGSPWTDVTIPISASDFTLVGGTNISQTLQNVNTMRILSSSSPAWEGAAISATLDIDVIEASTTLSLDNFQLNEIIISPNPANTLIQLKKPSNSNLSINSVVVFDLLGKQVYTSKVLESLIDVSKWSKGMYILKISANNFSKTIRFLKQ
ncbi:T9SS type A sorting domain-containing protein [Mariniflexile soesokkakense]|uniref:T9SS type A sorting domain-containing protein n=1 Tax=Mariniflexile soesokkakense TaxID=1343160 RepID=A0ABV0AEL3_9FLAO